MKKFAVNDEVMFISEDGLAELGRVGKITNIHELKNGDIAIVEFSDGLEKIPLENLVKVKREPVEEPKDEKTEEKAETEEIPEGARKISKDEMTAALVKITSPDYIESSLKLGFKSMFFGLTAVMVGTRIIDELYGDKDTIVITREDLEKTLRNGLDLKKLSEGVGGRMDAVRLVPVGITCALVLKHLIPELFGESENA
jgi:hypothetical protein